MRRLRREWRSVLFLAVMVILSVWMMVWMMGCSSGPIGSSGGGLFGLMPGNAGPDPTQPGSEAQRSLWPFTTLGFLFTLAGGVWWLISGSRKALMLGVGLSLTPFVSWWLISRLAPAIDWIIIPLSIVVGLSGAGFLVLFLGRKMGWIDASRTARMEAVLLRRKAANGATEEEKRELECEACVLEQIAEKPMRQVITSHRHKEPAT